MWRNTEVFDFVEWLREHNAARRSDARVGFYGLDLYSLYRSIEAVIRYPDRVDSDAARRARQRYACFEQFGDEAQRLRPRDRGRLRRAVCPTPWTPCDHTSCATASPPRPSSGRNSHLGDASATKMGAHGELNLGQLARERHGEETRLVGFTTSSGTVTAASDWGAAVERKRVRLALAGSWESTFHETGIPRFLLVMRGGTRPAGQLYRRRLERAIGVIYRPETERASHYFDARIAGRLTR